MSQFNVIDSEGLSQFELTDSPIRFGQLRYREVNSDNLVCLNDDIWLHKNAALAFVEMANAMHRCGVTPIVIKNGYRSYKRQARTFDYYRVKKEFGTVKTLTRVALPGHSEHHTGFAVDIRLPKNSGGRLANSNSYQWLKKHAHEYGFHESYKKNNIFGTVFEPWHWCFNGCPESRSLFSTRSLLLKNIDSSDQCVLDIIRSNDPMNEYYNELMRSYPKVYAALVTH